MRTCTATSTWGSQPRLRAWAGPWQLGRHEGAERVVGALAHHGAEIRPQLLERFEIGPAAAADADLAVALGRAVKTTFGHYEGKQDGEDVWRPLQVTPFIRAVVARQCGYIGPVDITPMRKDNLDERMG